MMTRARPRPYQLARVSNISARMPPSPWLSARITNRQYLIETVMISSQKISESDPSAADGDKPPSKVCATACSV